MKGRYAWNRRTLEGLEKGIQFFNQAIKSDASFALAWVGLADCYNGLGGNSYLAPQEAFPQAKAAAINAFKFDENLAEAHASLGFVAYMYDWNWEEAEKEFRQAIALNPNYATAHHWYALYLDSMGRFEEGLSEYNRAKEIDPSSMYINANLGLHYIMARQYDQAVKQLTATLEIDPNVAYVHHNLGHGYLQMQAMEDSIAEWQKALKLEADSPRYVAHLGYAYAKAGRRSEASKMLSDLEELSQQGRHVSPYWRAMVIDGIRGTNEEGLKVIEKGYKDHSEILCLIKVFPFDDPYRSDPRFKALLRKMNFPEK